MVHGIAKNRSAYLFGTCSAYSTIVLIEPQAVRLKRQSAVFEQATNLGLDVRDNIFVNHTMYSARQHRIEVRHQCHVVAVVRTEIAQVIGKVLAASTLPMT